MSRSRALKRVIVAYLLWLMLEYAAMVFYLSLGVRPVQVFYQAPWAFNFFVVQGLPGILAAVIAYFWRGRLRDKVALSSVFLVGAILWVGLFMTRPLPMPVDMVEEVAAKYGFTKCGEYRLKPGANTFTFNMTIETPTKCYFIILRPEQRYGYLIRLINPVHYELKILANQSETNAYHRRGINVDTFSDFYSYAKHPEPLYYTPKPSVGDYKLKFNYTFTVYPDDLILWFIFDRDYGPLGRGQYVRAQAYARVDFYVERSLP